ncbi:hypothetical protein DdX_21246 [Ditylenchus destructor]|uniref:Uncharacterized protein n=1 Tax=Ditylenchus destructor TaxID=166010 RepID=A0AAD4QVW3_9BILA|nr:hypothetical protein DdX_21246 [Ditylenchus destructor]
MVSEINNGSHHDFDKDSSPKGKLMVMQTFCLLSMAPAMKGYYNDEAENHCEFHLDNERTGERLSLFRDKRYCYRLWRRTVTSSDSTWLSALIGGEFMEKEVREAARETGFDEEFYDYYLPVVYDIL